MKTEKLLFGMSLLFTLIAMAGCEKESEELPTCQNDQLLFDFTIQLSNYIDELISFHRERNPSFYYMYMDDVAKLNLEDKIVYYESIGEGYQPSFSSLWDGSEERVYTTEYVLSLNSVLDTMDASLRKHLLSVAIDKHRKKFGVEYVTPFQARRSGILLILSILQYENAYTVLDKICGYCSKYNLDDPIELSVNNNFNKFLIKEVSRYLSK